VRLPWTYDFDESFLDEYGFDIKERLPELLWELPDGEISLARYYYHDHICERFTKAFSDQCGKWCSENGIYLTGHMMEEAPLKRQTEAVGETMRAYRSFDLPGVDIEVSFDGGNTVEKRSFLLSSIANGRFCGGGFKSNPIAALNDGLMDICLIKPVTRRKFLSLVSSYKNGTHLENEKAKPIIDYIQCASVDYYFGKMHNIGIDGEVSQAESLHIEVARGALNFIVPKGMLADSVAPEKAVAPECEIAYTE
jgi:hypothetical protein